MSNLHQNNMMTRSNGNLGVVDASGAVGGEHHDHQLQPIMSQYGGELTSRSGQQHHNMLDRTASSEDATTNDVRRSRETPLRSNSRRPKPANANDNMPRQQKPQAEVDTSNLTGAPLQESCSIVDDDSKLDANAYLMNHMST